MEQVWGAIGAVFGSWMNDRAIVYRRTYGIPHEWGTAVNVRAMVFGNLGDDCATGVAMTRDVALGVPGFNGDYLINAQGEDVVAGIRTPKRIEETLGQGHARGVTSSWSRSARSSKRTTATCRTSSSRSSAARSGCCKPATPSGPVSPPCGSPSTWSTKG